MPVIKSAKKKLRQDKKRTLRNEAFEEAYKRAVKSARKSPTAESIRLAAKTADKAVKHHIIHKNKAARVKSALAKLLGGKAAPAAKAKAGKKKTPKK